MRALRKLPEKPVDDPVHRFRLVHVGVMRRARNEEQGVAFRPVPRFVIGPDLSRPVVLSHGQPDWPAGGCIPYLGDEPGKTKVH